MSDLDRLKRKPYEYPPDGTPCDVSSCSCKIHPDNVAMCVRSCGHITCYDGDCHDTCAECRVVTMCKPCMVYDPDWGLYFCCEDCKRIYNNKEVEKMRKKVG